jgi:hypothetical protein
VKRGEETTTTELMTVCCHSETKKTHLRTEFQNKPTQRRQQNKTKQSTRSSALTALFGSENGVFWYFGHTTRVVCLAFVRFRLKF